VPGGLHSRFSHAFLVLNTSAKRRDVYMLYFLFVCFSSIATGLVVVRVGQSVRCVCLYVCRVWILSFRTIADHWPICVACRVAHSDAV